MPMKNEPLFNFVTIAILAGVIAAFTSAARGEEGMQAISATCTSPGTWDKKEVIATASRKTDDRDVATTIAGEKGTRIVPPTLPGGRVEMHGATLGQGVVAPPGP
jgi:hypothetical protein